MATQLETNSPENNIATPSFSLWLSTFFLTLAFFPLLTWMSVRLWYRPHYQFFPILLMSVGYLAYLRFSDLPKQASRPWLRRILAMTSLFFLLIATLFASPLIGLIAALFCSLAVVYTVGGWPWLRSWLPLWGTLWLLVPPPNNLDLLLIDGLQSLVVRVSSRALDLLGVLHLRVGHVLEVPGKRLLVDEACSGIHGLFSTLAFVLLYAIYLHRSLLQSLFLIIVCLFWVIVCNVLRVTLIGWCDARWGFDLSTGWPHTVLGLLTFAMGLGLILSSERFLWFVLPMFIPTSPSELADEIRSPTDLLPWQHTWLTSWSCLSLFALLGVIHAGEWGVRFLALPQRSAADAVPSLSLPKELAGWKRLDDHPCERSWPMGVHSQAWAYRKGSHVAVLAVDAPLRGYHPLQICYRNSGWTIDRLVCLESGSSPDGLPRTEAIVNRPSGRFGLVMFSLIAESGEWIDPPGEQEATTNYLWSRTMGRFHRRSLESISYQMQLFVDQSIPVDDEFTKDLRRLFASARSIWVEQLQAHGSVQTP